MFRNFANQLIGEGASAGGDANARKALPPTLRPDIYSLVDSTKAWAGAGQPGDGVSYGALLTVVQKYFPNAKRPGGPLEASFAFSLSAGQRAEGEIAAVVGGVTNMVLELSRWEGMAAGMAMRTWVDTLVDLYARVPDSEAARKEAMAKGITRGLNQVADPALLTKEFTTRVQVISCLKTVSARIYGAGTDEARQSEAMWSSKFI